MMHGSPRKKWIEQQADDATRILAARQKPDTINSPPHYVGKNGIEVCDVVDGFDLGPWEAQAVQYMLRAKFKGTELEDLQKARWCLTHRIDSLIAGRMKVMKAEAVT